MASSWGLQDGCRPGQAVCSHPVDHHQPRRSGLAAAPASSRIHRPAGWRNLARRRSQDDLAWEPATAASPRVQRPPRGDRLRQDARPAQGWVQDPMGGSSRARDVSRCWAREPQSAAAKLRWAARGEPDSVVAAIPRSAAESLEPGAGPCPPCRHRPCPWDAACSAWRAARWACSAVPSASADEEPPSAAALRASTADLQAWPAAPPLRRRGPSRASRHRHHHRHRAARWPRR